MGRESPLSNCKERRDNTNRHINNSSDDAMLQVLIGEISEPRLRGVFSSAPGVAYSLGILLVYALGSLLPWRMVAATATLLPIAGFFVFIFLPESPVWLVNTGQVDEAKKSLMWLRGGNHTKVTFVCLFILQVYTFSGYHVTDNFD